MIHLNFILLVVHHISVLIWYCCSDVGRVSQDESCAHCYSANVGKSSQVSSMNLVLGSETSTLSSQLQDLWQCWSLNSHFLFSANTANMCWKGQGTASVLYVIASCLQIECIMRYFEWFDYLKVTFSTTICTSSNVSVPWLCSSLLTVPSVCLSDCQSAYHRVG